MSEYYNRGNSAGIMKTKNKNKVKAKFYICVNTLESDNRFSCVVLHAFLMRYRWMLAVS